MEKSEIVIRQEDKSEWHRTEYLTKKAFWNLNMPGCDEHYLVHKIRTDSSYIPELSRVAVLGDEIVGAIFYERAHILHEGKKYEVLTFGPLCVDPACQKHGIGKTLLTHTMQIAREAGHRAIVICGVPAYYPKFGFLTCDHYGITMPDGSNFDAFMGIDLVEGTLASLSGIFYEPEIMHDYPPEEVDRFDLSFPQMEKKILPGQWRTPDDSKGISPQKS